jgi:hypothetical protein
MPIVFVCEENVSENERTIIHNKFRNSGYGRVAVKSYQPFVEQFVKVNYREQYNNALTVWTEGKDLYLTLFDLMGQKSSQSLKLTNLGIDPRVDYVVEQIWNAVLARNPFLSKEEEIDVLKAAANNFLNSTTILHSSCVTLSDNQDYYYTLDRNMIDYYQYETRGQLLNEVRSLLARNEVQLNNTLVVLRGVAASNNYFSAVLSSIISGVVSDNDLRCRVMKMILEEPIEVSPIFTSPVTIPKSPQSSGEEPNHPTEESTSIVDCLTKEVSKTVDGVIDVIKENGNALVDWIGSSKDLIVDLTKEWRKEKAIIHGKARSGKIEEARKQLNDFLEKCKNANASELTLDIEKLKQEINEVSKNSEEPKVDLTREWREERATIKGLVRSGKIEDAEKKLNIFLEKSKKTNSIELIHEIEQEKPTLLSVIKGKSKDNQVNSSKSEVKLNEGEELLSKGLVVEARDWYQKNTVEEDKVRLLKEIIRLQKSVETRKHELANCQKTKDRQRIQRIITEMSDYISKCQQVGIPTEEWKKILLEYKKIK